MTNLDDKLKCIAIPNLQFSNVESVFKRIKFSQLVALGICSVSRMMKPQGTQESTWRVFCAIEIPNEVRERVLKHAARLREAAPATQASWTRMENIHLTLKFFGNVQRDTISKISQAADAVTRLFSPINIVIDGTGAFPKHGAPRVLWIGLNDASGKLVDLQKEFERECNREGFATEDRAFHPHLTVARLRSPQGARTLGELHKEAKFEAMDFTVTGLTLFRSEVSSKGSRYTVISKHDLVGM